MKKEKSLEEKIREGNERLKNTFKKIKDDVDKYSNKNTEKDKNNDSALSSFHGQQGKQQDRKHNNNSRTSNTNLAKNKDQVKSNNSVITDKLLISN